MKYQIRGNKLIVVFENEAENELARINIGWNGKSLHGYFAGARENAETLALVLSTMGAKVKAKQIGKEWHVQMTTDSIIAIRHPRWIEAIKAYVEALYKHGVISRRRMRRLLKDIENGPNVVEVAGVKFSVKIDKKKSKPRLLIRYLPRSPEAFDRAVNALKNAGFEEDKDFTAKRPDGDQQGYIHLTKAGLKRLMELGDAGVDWARKAVARLRSIAKSRSDILLEEYV